MPVHDVIVIGGGAAGLACAITAARRGSDVCMLEKNPAPGKKIYATGNGRCNITNGECEGAADVRGFFRSIGLEIVFGEEGRAYPMSRQAADVVYVLEKQIENIGVEFHGNVSVDWVGKKDGCFDVTSGCDSYRAKRIVIATGGKAAPKFGTTGDGYTFAQAFGHSIAKPIPILTGIECEGDFSALKGVRAEAVCTLYCKGEQRFTEKGEVQFTEYGLSGICIFNMSRHLLLSDETSFGDYEIHLDFSNGSGAEQFLMNKIKTRGLAVKDVLRGMVPAELASIIVKKSIKGDVELNSPIETVDEEQLRRLLDDYSGLRFKVKGARGWQMAQCTKGGVRLDEIDMQTMESKMTSGVFFAGEVIDYDGPCGGFNLQNAWETGIKAGKHV